MKFHELQVAGKKSTKRVGRGIAAGGGKTAGRGTKGQKARTGKKIKLGFEGGQTKLSSRLPKKRGFTARNQTIYRIINLDDLAQITGTTVNHESLLKAGMIRNQSEMVKLLGDGEVSKALTVELNAVSKSAIDQITKAGGTVNSSLHTPRPTAKRSKKMIARMAEKAANEASGSGKVTEKSATLTKSKPETSAKSAIPKTATSKAKPAKPVAPTDATDDNKAKSETQV